MCVWLHMFIHTHIAILYHIILYFYIHLLGHAVLSTGNPSAQTWSPNATSNQLSFGQRPACFRWPIGVHLGFRDLAAQLSSWGRVI